MIEAVRNGSTLLLDKLEAWTSVFLLESTGCGPGHDIRRNDSAIIADEMAIGMIIIRPRQSG